MRLNFLIYSASRARVFVVVGEKVHVLQKSENQNDWIVLVGVVFLENTNPRIR